MGETNGDRRIPRNTDRNTEQRGHRNTEHGNTGHGNTGHGNTETRHTILSDYIPRGHGGWLPVAVKALGEVFQCGTLKVR